MTAYAAAPILNHEWPSTQSMATLSSAPHSLLDNYNLQQQLVCGFAAAGNDLAVPAATVATGSSMAAATSCLLKTVQQSCAALRRRPGPTGITVSTLSGPSTLDGTGPAVAAAAATATATGTSRFQPPSANTSNSGMHLLAQQLLAAVNLGPGCIPGPLLTASHSHGPQPSPAPANPLGGQELFSAPGPSNATFPGQHPETTSSSSRAYGLLYTAPVNPQAHAVHLATLAAQGVCSAVAAIYQRLQAKGTSAGHRLSASERHALQQVCALAELRLRLQALTDHLQGGLASGSSSAAAGGAQRPADVQPAAYSSSSGTAGAAPAAAAAAADPVLVSTLAAVAQLLQQHDAAVQQLSMGYCSASASNGGSGAATGPNSTMTLLSLVTALAPLWKQLLELARLLRCLPALPPGDPAGSATRRSTLDGMHSTAAGLTAAARSDHIDRQQQQQHALGRTWLPAWTLPQHDLEELGHQQQHHSNEEVEVAGSRPGQGGSGAALPWPALLAVWVEGWSWAPCQWQLVGLPPSSLLLDDLYSELLHATGERQLLLRRLWVAAVQPCLDSLFSRAFTPRQFAIAQAASAATAAVPSTSSRVGWSSQTASKKNQGVARAGASCVAWPGVPLVVSHLSGPAAAAACPEFLKAEEHNAVTAGQQLCLLQELCPAAADLVQQLSQLHLQEQQLLLDSVAALTTANPAGAATLTGSYNSNGGQEGPLKNQLQLVANAASAATRLVNNSSGSSAVSCQVTAQQLLQLEMVLGACEQQRQQVVGQLLQRMAQEQAAEAAAGYATLLQRAVACHTAAVQQLQQQDLARLREAEQRAQLRAEQAAAAAAQKLRMLQAKQDERQLELQLMLEQQRAERAAAMAEVQQQLAALSATSGAADAGLGTREAGSVTDIRYRGDSDTGHQFATMAAVAEGGQGVGEEGEASEPLLEACHLQGDSTSPAAAAAQLGAGSPHVSSWPPNPPGRHQESAVGHATFAEATATASGRPPPPPQQQQQQGRVLLSRVAAGASKPHRRGWGLPQDPTRAAGVPSAWQRDPNSSTLAAGGSVLGPWATLGGAAVAGGSPAAAAAAARGTSRGAAPVSGVRRARWFGGGGSRMLPSNGAQASADEGQADRDPHHASSLVVGVGAAAGDANSSSTTGGTLQSVQSAARPGSSGGGSGNLGLSVAGLQQQAEQAFACSTALAAAAEEATLAAPLQTVLEVMVIRPLRAQQHLTTVACWQLLLHLYKLLPALRDLQLLFFQEAGDWAQQFAVELEQLRQQDAAVTAAAAAAGAGAGGTGAGGVAAGSVLTPVRARIALQAALQCSSVEGKAVVEYLDAQVAAGRQLPGWQLLLPGQEGDGSSSSEPAVAEGATANSAGASTTAAATAQLGLAWSNQLVLTAAVPWPLDLVVTQQHLELYGAVFSVLLLFRRTQCQLNTCWQQLRVQAKRIRAEQRQHATEPGQGAEVAGRIRHVCHWVQHALQFVSSQQQLLQLQLQADMEAFAAGLTQQPLTVADMQLAHERMAQAAAAAAARASGGGEREAGLQGAADTQQLLLLSWQLAEQMQQLVVDEVDRSLGTAQGGRSQSGDCSLSSQSLWLQGDEAWNELERVGSTLQQGLQQLRAASEPEEL